MCGVEEGMNDPRAAYADFVRGSSTRLLRTAFLLVGDRSAAEDLLQDVLERVYVAWPRVEDPVAYAHRSLVRAAQNRWRTRVRRPEEPWGERDVAVHDPDLAQRDALLRALATLPRGQRAVVVLRFLEDLSTEQTARVLDCSIGTVKSQTSRALPKLRALLDPTTLATADENGTC